MAIPKTHELYTQVLQSIANGNPTSLSDVRHRVRDSLDLTTQDSELKSRGGGNQVFVNINWAISHLAQAEALQRPEKGFVQITELGRALLADNPGSVNRDAVRATEGYRAWQSRSAENKRSRKNVDLTMEDSEVEASTDGDPISLMNQAQESIRNDVASQLLDRIRNESPEFLEKLVLQLLLAMGYGASEEDLEHTGKSSDEGIDGVVKQDLLGLEKIYIQAKRYRDQSTVGGEAIQAFMGALSMKNASKGVFITTSRFSSAAQKYVDDLRNQSIVLIDGPKLVNFMIDHGVGVTKVETYSVVAVDENFFGDE